MSGDRRDHEWDRDRDRERDRNRAPGSSVKKGMRGGGVNGSKGQGKGKGKSKSKGKGGGRKHHGHRRGPGPELLSDLYRPGDDRTPRSARGFSPGRYRPDATETAAETVNRGDADPDIKGGAARSSIVVVEGASGAGTVSGPGGEAGAGTGAGTGTRDGAGSKETHSSTAQEGRSVRSFCGHPSSHMPLM
jgi:hypothetical protein